jgi:hypothetical protein
MVLRLLPLTIGKRNQLSNYWSQWTAFEWFANLVLKMNLTYFDSEPFFWTEVFQTFFSCLKMIREEKKHLSQVYRAWNRWIWFLLKTETERWTGIFSELRNKYTSSKTKECLESLNSYITDFSGFECWLRNDIALRKRDDPGSF